MKNHKFGVILTLIPVVLTGCSKSGEIQLQNVQHELKVLGSDFCIEVSQPGNAVSIYGKYSSNTIQWNYQSTDSSTSFEWDYYDDTQFKFTLEDGERLRYTYGDWDSSFYSVILSNFTFSNGQFACDLIISGQNIGRINAYYAIDSIGDTITTVSGLLTSADNPPNRTLKKIGSLIPPIDISLSFNNTLNINSHNYNIGGNLTDKDVAAQCIMAGVRTAEICLQAGGFPLIEHNDNHKNCKFDCKEKKK